MARKQGDSESGKLGDKILYTWHGRQCERSMPTSVANPQTEAQQAHRMKGWLHPAEPMQAGTNTLTHSHTNAFSLHLYAFLRSTRGRTSDTIHLALSV